MSTTEEKSTNSADGTDKKEDEQQAVAAAAETEGDNAEAKGETSAKAADAPAEEKVEKPAAAETKSDAPAEAKGDAPAEAKGEASADDGTDELEIEVEAVVDPTAELKEQIASLEAGKQKNYDRLLRAMADLENFRKRSRRDVKDARLDERGKILRDMLPVIDNLERAALHAVQSDNEATKSIVEGVNLVLRQFKQALERHQVTPLDAVGKTFDPAVHEAVSQAPSADHPPGTVLSTLQSGYMMDGRLLRPSLVVVSVAVPAEEKVAEPEAELAAADVIDVESSEGTADAGASDESASESEPAADKGADVDESAAADADSSKDEASSEDEASGGDSAPEAKKDDKEDKE